MPHRDWVVEFWDRYIGAWLAGRNELIAPLYAWCAGFRGKGDGAVQLDGMPEPYFGDLLGSPIVALL